MIDREKLAKLIHESARAAVANDDHLTRKYLIQVAAMCLRTLIDWPLIQHVEFDLTILHRLDTPEVEVR